MTKKVLVLGGYGACGSHISRLLARDAGIACVIGGRDVVRGGALADELGALFVPVDITRPASLNAALEGVFAVVNACGPFHWQDYTVAERCARRGVHYVDFATDRGYVLGIAKLSPQAAGSGAALVSGGGSLLALSSVLVDAIRDPFDTIDRIDVAVSYGGGCQRGVAAMRALLYGQRLPAQVHEEGVWRQAPGWSRGQVVEWPAPLGRRRLYAVDAPEVSLFAERYGAPVTYRAGLESPAMNHALAWLGSMSRMGIIGDLPSRAGLVHGLYRWMRGSGQARFGLRVSLTGTRDQRELVRSAGLVAEDRDMAAHCAPVLALVRRWIAGQVIAGAGPFLGLLSLADMTEELQQSKAVLLLS